MYSLAVFDVPMMVTTHRPLARDRCQGLHRLIRHFLSRAHSCTLRSATSRTRTLSMMERLPDNVPLPRLWTAFAVAWLLVLFVVVWRLPTAGLSAAHLGGSAACLALLASSYSWLTIR